MAQKKISELDRLQGEIKDNSILPVVQDGSTRSVRYVDLINKTTKDVNSNVENYVDNKMTSKTNYALTTMVDLGFTEKSYVSVRSFWDKLYSKYGSQGIIQFNWNDAKAAYVGHGDTSAYITGGILIYNCNGSPNSWRLFTAVYYNGSNNSVYHIRCNINTDTTNGNEGWSVSKLAYNGDVLEVRSSLLDVSGKLDYMYKRYPSQGKVIGKWYDGRNIWRVVYLAKDLTVTSAYANGVSVYGFTGGLTKQNDVDLFLSAKIHWKSGATLQDMEVLLANNDCLFVTVGANSSLTTGNVDCLVVEFVEK